MAETELTTLHQKLLMLLNELGVDYDLERPVTVGGKTYQMDCYLPVGHACVEADGPSHGLRRKKDRERDAALASVGIVTIRIKYKLLEGRKDKVLARLTRVLSTLGETVRSRRALMRDRDALLQ
mgnify:CR=1 FL=1